jgi:hypothetical protein
VLPLANLAADASLEYLDPEVVKAIARKGRWSGPKYSTFIVPVKRSDPVIVMVPWNFAIPIAAPSGTWFDESASTRIRQAHAWEIERRIQA